MGKHKELLSILDEVITEADGFITSAKKMVSHGERLLSCMKEAHSLFTDKPKTKPNQIAEAKTYSKEEVRAVLSEKSASGYGKEVKALLIKFGADKLSTLSPNSYEAVITEAKEIGNE